MSETPPTYIPCAAGGQSQRECLFRITGSLVELLGHAGMQFAPTDARTAAQTLWAMADSIDGKKTPRIDSQAVKALIEAAQDVSKSAYYLSGDIEGPDDMVGEAMALKALETALNALTGDE